MNRIRPAFCSRSWGSWTYMRVKNMPFGALKWNSAGKWTDHRVHSLNSRLPAKANVIMKIIYYVANGNNLGAYIKTGLKRNYYKGRFSLNLWIQRSNQRWMLVQVLWYYWKMKPAIGNPFGDTNRPKYLRFLLVENRGCVVHPDYQSFMNMTEVGLGSSGSGDPSDFRTPV